MYIVHLHCKSKFLLISFVILKRGRRGGLKGNLNFFQINTPVLRGKICNYLKLFIFLYYYDLYFFTIYLKISLRWRKTMWSMWNNIRWLFTKWSSHKKVNVYLNINNFQLFYSWKEWKEGNVKFLKQLAAKCTFCHTYLTKYLIFLLCNWRSMIVVTWNPSRK